MDTPMLEHNPRKRIFSDMMMTPTPSAPSSPQRSGTQEPASVVSHNEFVPRSYQLKVFEVAMKRNTIAVLETGSGKTMIAVMLIKEIGRSIKDAADKRLILFLAPTVHLVTQQYGVIKDHTSLQVEMYYGARGVDGWTKTCWEKEIEEHDVLVMTPQILLDALGNAFLNLEMVSLIVLDECHRATGNHPYAKIMKEFYHKLHNRPKVFGMTASPVVRKGVSSAMDCERQISELESILNSQIFTIEDRSEVDIYVASPREVCRFYNKSQFSSSDLRAKLEDSWSKFDASMLNLQESAQNSYEDMNDKLKTLRKSLSNDYAKILNCLEDLGLKCAYEAVEVCLENASNPSEECDMFREISLQCKHFLEEVLFIIGESLAQGDDCFLNSSFDDSKAVELGYISAKLYELLQIFHSFGGDRPVLCLIFVERIVTANVIARFMKKIESLSHFTVSYLTGTNTSVGALAPKVQRETLESFRSGKVNLLFSTDVVEEGIHVPNCSCVIRFDLPKTVRSYVQSRGRARQSNSQFITLVKRGNVQQRDHLYDIIRSEWSMTDAARNRDPDVWNLRACTTKETEAYVVEVTRASVTADSSISLIYRYCEKLPGDRYHTPRPTFEFEYVEQSFQCKITLPHSAAFQTIVGPGCQSQPLAKRHACLEACKRLHQMGALDDHLQPTIEKASENNLIVKNTELCAGAGTTKRKELHGTTCICALSGTWGESLDGATFHAYKFCFTCNIITEIYSGFVLLIESELDYDVGNLELDLYLIAKTVKSSVSSCGLVSLDEEQIRKAKWFHELFFNGVFGKLFAGSSKSAEIPREFLLKKETRSLWSPSNMYLLVPIETSITSNDESLRINWTALDASYSAIEFFRNYLGAQDCNWNKGTPSLHVVGSSSTQCDDANGIHFANCIVDIDGLKNKVALAVHTGRIYCIVEALSNTSAESPFEFGNDNDLLSQYATFSEYYNKKYGILLKHRQQPMLQLKQSHNPYNLLVNFNDKGTSQDGIGKKCQYVHVPPELLVIIDVPSYVLKSLYLLPSLMHRLESLMLASQLRQEINCLTPNFYIPSSLILEAITTVRCCENFSMERLELLGDSVLKYAVGCHLFLSYPKKHEDQLSYCRSRIVSNANLHKLGIDCKLQGYIRDSAFEPRCWIAPGHQPVHLNPCACGVNTLEVPLDPKFLTESPNVKLGKSCDMGHRWLASKTISDCVEAVIGAYYFSGGLTAALHVMKWLGIDVQTDLSLVLEAINSASVHSYIPKEEGIESLESKLGYTFSVKFLLEEAITHASMQERGVTYCYQRLEFLGDCVLDLLITWHHFQTYPEIDPGELTDLRSASVNNESFARVAVRRDLYKHFRHCSTLLLSQLTEYQKSFSESEETGTLAAGPKGPKPLGDMVESIAGAMLIDTKLNLDEVWRIFKPLLSPIVTPQSLELPPLRELTELCDSLGYCVKPKCIKKGETVHAEIEVQLKDCLLVGKGNDKSTKAAKGKAASLLLKELEKKGLAYSRGGFKRRKLDSDNVVESCSLDMEDDKLPELTKRGRQKQVENQLLNGSNTDPSLSGCPKQNTPVIESIERRKGGPRMTLFEICRKMQFPRPTFETQESSSRTPLEFADGPEGTETRKGFNSFVSTVTLNIPWMGNVECKGDPEPDKKSSYDSAARALLYKLQEQGLLIISDHK